MGVLGKISLFTVFFSSFLIIPPVIPFNACSGIAWGAEIKSFGTDGQNGQSGQPGQNSQNADNMTIFSDGSPLTLNLAGRDGQSGQNGSNGETANCGNQPVNVRYNVQAPDGGNGGNGGNGGDGGNGGSLTIYATDPAYLRQIYVNAAGGKAGQPGQGGMGGQGCLCENPYWTIETCTGKPGDPDYRCTTAEFRCQNGRNGTNGLNGVAGREGLVGKLTLINLDKPLETDEPAATVTMATLKDKGYILSRNIWETRTGARVLLASGSIIDDQYLALVERLERSFILVWNAPQFFQNFADQKISISLENNQGIKVDLPQDLWIEGTTQQQKNFTQFIVYNAMRSQDATQLESQGLLGNRRDLKLTLVDKANQSNLIATKFKISYRTTQSDPRFRPVSDYTTRYEGEIPEDLISLDGNKFTINVGQLPINDRDLRSGLGVEIKLVATRSFAGYTAEQTITVREVLGPFK